MTKREAFIIMRVLVRLHEQGNLAWMTDREADARSLYRLIGKLEYQIFDGDCLIETALASLEAA